MSDHVITSKSRQKSVSFYRWFFYRSRGDSPFVKMVIHAALILACLITIYPVLRVVTVSLRPGNRVLSTSLDLIPTERLRVPEGLTEKEIFIAHRESSKEEIQTALDALIRRNRTKPTAQKEVKFEFSGRVETYTIPEDFQDLEMESLMYRGADKIQERLDVVIRSKLSMSPAGIQFTGRDVSTFEVPEGTKIADMIPFFENQSRENSYSGMDQDDKSALVTIGGVTETLSVPSNIGISQMASALLYQAANAPELSYTTATLSNYTKVIFDSEFLLWIWNSILITVSTSFMGVALASTSAYAFSRFTFPGRKAGLIFLLTTQMIPGAMLLLPIYILAYNLGLIGSWRGLVISYSVSSIPFSIWILKGYYDTIPKELEEAATIDGATKMQTFWKIMLPLAAPALAIVFLFNFMQAWNDFLLARILLTRPEIHTWTLGLQRMQGQFNTQWGMFSAAALMVSVPVVILFLASSKYLVSGLTMGSVKG